MTYSDEHTEPEPVSVASSAAYHARYRELVKQCGWFQFDLDPTRLVLDDPPDLFRYELAGRFLISKKLRDAIARSGLTGCVMEPFDIDVRVADG